MSVAVAQIRVKGGISCEPIATEVEDSQTILNGRVESTSVAVAQVPVYFAEYPVVSPVTQKSKTCRRSLKLIERRQYL